MSDNNYISPLLAEPVNEKKYTDKIYQKSEVIELDTEKKKTEDVKDEKQVEETNKKAVVPELPGGIDEQIINEIEAEKEKETKTTFVSDEEDGVPGMNFSQTGSQTNSDGEAEMPMGESPKATITPEIAGLFSEVIMSAAKTYVPKIFIKYSQLPENRVKYVLQKYSHRISEDDAAKVLNFFKESNETISRELQITDEEAELLQKTFIAFLEYKNVQAATPENAFYMQAGFVFLRLGATSFALRKDLRNQFNDLMKTKFDIDKQK